MAFLQVKSGDKTGQRSAVRGLRGLGRAMMTRMLDEHMDRQAVREGRSLGREEDHEPARK
jgi:hypothetical protein